VLLGLSPALDICGKTAILSQFDAAIQSTARDEPAQVDHVCCGAFGRVEALLSAGQALGRSDLMSHAWRLAGAVVTRARGRGHFRLCGPGVEYRVFDPGFFRGLSGIGYGLLRLAAPGRLPSIARLDPPGRAERPPVA
jgi:lantibiotic modifying enzyme